MAICVLGVNRECYGCVLFDACKLPVQVSKAARVNFNQGVYGPDVSFYQDNNETPLRIDFQKMKAAGATFVIIRAGQNSWVDPDFSSNYAEAKKAGLPRGIYWFYDSRSTPTFQAVLCYSLIANDPPELGTWLDLEENYGGQYKGWQNWKLCLSYLRTKTNDVGIYTAPYYWIENRPTGEGDLAYFKSFPLWIAHYNVTTPIVPSPWTSALLWQYGTPAVGLQYGVESIEIDMNRFDGDINTFMNYFDLTVTEPQPTDITTQPYDGVTQITGVRNGWRWWLHICDPAKVRYEVVNSATVETVSSIARLAGAQLAWNGSDYNRVTHELHIGSPSFYKSGDVRNNVDGDVFGVRPLITNGDISLRLYQGDAAATEGHSRCCFGKTADGKTMHFVSEGAYPNQGLRLSECAEIMKQYGAIIAADAGGGGDTTLVIEGELQNIPEDIDGGIHRERRIPQVLLAYVQEGNTMNGTAREVLNNTTTVRNEPSRYGADSGSKLPAGGVVEFVEIVPVVVKGIADNRDDKWLKLPNGKYINYILGGREYYHVLTMPTTDTPAPAEKMANVHLVITDDEGFSATVDVDVVMVKS